MNERTENKKNMDSLDRIAESILAEMTKDDGKSALQIHSEQLFIKNLDKRIIWVDTEIHTDVSLIGPTILDVAKQILAWNEEDKGKPVEERIPIKVLIYCFGGDLDATLSLVSLMNISKTPVYTYNMGVAYSGGFLLLVNGHKRFALPNSTGLFHEGSAQIQGTAEEVKSAQNNYEKQLDLVKNNLLAHTKITPKMLKSQKNKEWYMTSSELLELGVVDEILQDIDSIV